MLSSKVHNKVYKVCKVMNKHFESVLKRSCAVIAILWLVTKQRYIYFYILHLHFTHYTFTFKINLFLMYSLRQKG